jgi:hypothetical protein
LLVELLRFVQNGVVIREPRHLVVSHSGLLVASFRLQCYRAGAQCVRLGNYLGQRYRA